MKEVTLEVRSRKDKGKGAARKLRAAGKLPAVIYGHNEEPSPIELDYDLLYGTMHKAGGEKLLISLNVDGKDSGKKALIKEIQRDPVSGKMLHIDFQHVSLTEEIKIEIPIRLEGTSEGVKNFGGIISWNIRKIMVSCLPTNIPDKVTIDVTPMKIHDSVHVKDITLENVEILDDPEETIISVIPPTVVKEEVVVEEEGEVAPAPSEVEEEGEPEVISEKKAEERQAEKEKGDKK